MLNLWNLGYNIVNILVNGYPKLGNNIVNIWDLKYQTCGDITRSKTEFSWYQPNDGVIHGHRTFWSDLNQEAIEKYNFLWLLTDNTWYLPDRLFNIANWKIITLLP